MSLTTADIIAKRKRNRKTADILLDPELKTKIEQLTADIEQADRDRIRGKGSSLADTDLHTMREQLADLYREAEESTAKFVFQDIGRQAFVDLIKAHPATEETKRVFTEAGEEIPEYDPDTFVPALLSACAVDPIMSLEEAQLICSTWSEADLETMFLTAYVACRERTSIPFSAAGIEQIGNIEPSSTTGSVTALDGSNGNGTSTP